ncbi:MAG: hypothetical protein QM783_10070 [Phycisphaerales bacterium]
MCVRSAAVLAAMAGVAAGLGGRAHADTLTFSNDCGTGLWGTLCPIGGGNYQSNWGRTGAPSPALLPAAGDLVTISGTVTMDVSPTVALVTVPSGSSLVWSSTALTGAITNGGTVSANTGSNKFLFGSAGNAAGGVWNISDGSFYLSPGSLTNASGGTVNFSHNGALRRNGGSIAESVLSNSGVVRVTDGNSTLGSITLQGGATGVFETATGSSLTLEGVMLSGTLNGDHDGDVTFASGCGLADNTTLTTAPGSNPWGWSSAAFDTGTFTLTNAGWLRLDTGFNKFFTGAAVNGPTGTWAIEQGALYLSPGATPTTLTNIGTVVVNSALRRNGGALQNAVLNNTGAVRTTASGAAISGIALVSGGLWATDPAQRLTLSASGSAAHSPATTRARRRWGRRCNWWATRRSRRRRAAHTRGAGRLPQ